MPDRFGPVPLCAEPGGVKADPAELLLLSKRPGAAAAESACYALLRVQPAAGEPVVRSATGEAIGAGAAPGATDHWQSLVVGLLPWLPRAADGSGPPTASTAPRMSTAAPALVTMQVRQARARLFEHADAGSGTQRFLVAGDRVQVLGDSRRAEGWLQVRYVGRKGRVLDGWMQASTLAQMGRDTETSAVP